MKVNNYVDQDDGFARSTLLFKSKNVPFLQQMYSNSFLAGGDWQIEGSRAGVTH